MSRVRLGVAAGLLVGLVAAAAGQDAKQSFALKFEKDKSFYQKLTTTVKQVLTVEGGSDIKLNHSQTYYFKWTPVAEDKGKWTVKQTVEGVQFKFDVAGQTVEYNSADAAAGTSSGNPGLAEFFKSLVGLEFTVTVGPNGKVEKVDGREEAFKKMAAVNPQLEQVLRKVLTEEAVKEMTDPSAGLAGEGEKKAGETWTKKSTVNLGPIGTYERTQEFTYKGKDDADKEADRVEVKPSLTYKASTGDAEGLPFRIKSGNLTTKEVKAAYYLFDPKAGRVKKAEVNVVLTGDLAVTVNTADAKVALFQDQKTELETADASLLPAKKP